jgi:hypothetical protein
MHGLQKEFVVIRNDEDGSAMDTTKLIVVRTFSNEINAEIARQKLASRGIESSISKDDEGGMLPSLQATFGVKLEVLEGNFRNSENILKETM